MKKTLKVIFYAPVYVIGFVLQCVIFCVWMLLTGGALCIGAVCFFFVCCTLRFATLFNEARMNQIKKKLEKTK